MDDKMMINIKLNGVALRLRIDRDEEELYRKSARTVSDLYTHLHNAYPDKSAQEIWMMTAYSARVECDRLRQDADGQMLAEHIRTIEEQVDKALENG